MARLHIILTRQQDWIQMKHFGMRRSDSEELWIKPFILFNLDKWVESHLWTSAVFSCSTELQTLYSCPVWAVSQNSLLPGSLQRKHEQHICLIACFFHTTADKHRPDIQENQEGSKSESGGRYQQQMAFKNNYKYYILALIVGVVIGIGIGVGVGVGVAARLFRPSGTL